MSWSPPTLRLCGCQQNKVGAVSTLNAAGRQDRRFKPCDWREDHATARVRHAPRRVGGDVAASGKGAAGWARAADRVLGRGIEADPVIQARLGGLAQESAKRSELLLPTPITNRILR